MRIGVRENLKGKTCPGTQGGCYGKQRILGSRNEPVTPLPLPGTWTMKEVPDKREIPGVSIIDLL